jgi:hypothetical protein
MKFGQNKDNSSGSYRTIFNDFVIYGTCYDELITYN